MKKCAFVLICISLLITSCAHLSPFLENDPYLSYCGKDGDYVYTMEADSLSYEQFNVTFTRITVAVDPITGEFDGALEGSFSQSKIKAALNFSKQFKKIGKNTWQDVSSSLQVKVASNGLLLFSSTDVSSLYEKTVVNKIKVFETDISYLLTKSECGFIVKNPIKLPDLGFDISKEGIESFNYIIATLDNGLASFTFNMNSDQFAQSLLKLIKTSVVSQIRQQGQKVDTQQLNSILFANGNTVYFNNQEYTGVTPEEILKSFIEVM